MTWDKDRTLTDRKRYGKDHHLDFKNSGFISGAVCCLKLILGSYIKQRPDVESLERIHNIMIMSGRSVGALTEPTFIGLVFESFFYGKILFSTSSTISAKTV